MKNKDSSQIYEKLPGNIIKLVFSNVNDKLGKETHLIAIIEKKVYMKQLMETDLDLYPLQPQKI